jgi:hypothetical protein
VPHLWGSVDAYPRPRERITQTPAGGLGVPSPQPRVWSIVLATGGPNFRATAVSPAFDGPAIIRSLTEYNFTTASAGKIGGIELYYSLDNSGAGTGQPITPPPTGTPIFQTFGDPTQQAKLQTLAMFVPRGPLSATNPNARTFPLGYVISDGRWFLKASLLSDDAAAVADVGLIVTLYERVDPTLLVDLLG